MLLLVGCSGGHAATKPSDATSAPPPVLLTGFGATQQAWSAGHVLDTDPRFHVGCCFLPIVTANGTQTATWVGLLGITDRVDSYLRNFADDTDEQIAIAMLSAQDLPPDAVLISNRQGQTCRILVYSSNAVAAQLGGDTIGVAVVLHSGELVPSGWSPYNPSHVFQAELKGALSSSASANC